MSHFRIETSDEEEWEQLVSDSEKPKENGKIVRIMSGRVINQNTPSGSDSGVDTRRTGLKFTHVDIDLERGIGDEPLPHAVPILGLRSARSSGRTARSATSNSAAASARSSGKAVRSATSNSAATSAKPFSSGAARRSMHTKASSRTLSVGISARPPYSRNSSRFSTARSAHSKSSTRINSSKVRSRSRSSETSDDSSSPRTYNILPSNRTTARTLPQVKSSRSAHSARSPNHLSSHNISPSRRRENDQPPGYWENVSEDRRSNLNNVCVWALADPPEPPPGIFWKKVTPPPSPVPTPKEVAIEPEMPEINDEGKENEPLDSKLDSSIHIVPELVPSLDPTVEAPKTVIRKVMVMPENAGYPGFCEPSEVERTHKNRKSSPKQIMGENKRILPTHKDKSKTKAKPSSSKEKPFQSVVNAHKINQGNGITPSSWRAGLKCAKKELGPWKAPVTFDKDEKNKGNEENSENVISEKLNDIRNYIDKAENKIVDYKLQKSNETKQDAGSSEVHIFHRESGKLKNSKVDKSSETIQNSKLDDLTDVPESLDEHVVNDILSEDKTKIISRKNSKDILVVNDMLKAGEKNVNHSRNSPKRAKKRHPGVKSAHNLNNAFVIDREMVLPKRANSLFNLPSDSKGVLQSKCAIRHYDPKAIKEYIRIQKKQRHGKLVEEKEKKKMQEEMKKTKLSELRSKSKELVEESLKKKAKCVNKELEFLQMFGKQLDELALNVNLKEKGDIAEVNATVSNSKPLLHISAEKKCLSDSDSIQSNVTSQSQKSLEVKPSNKLEIQIPSVKLDSFQSAEEDAPAKSVQHVALQTDEDFFKSVSDSNKNVIFGESDYMACSLRAPPCVVEVKVPVHEAKVTEKGTDISEKSGSSKSDSDKVVLDKELCCSIQREIKKLSHNVFVLEKHKMIGVLPEKGAIPSTSFQREVLSQNQFAVAANHQKSDLNNKKVSVFASDRLSCNKSLDSPLDGVVPIQNHVNPLCLSLTPLSILEKPAKAKQSVNNLICENQNGVNSLDAGDASVNMQTLIQTRKERITPSKNNKLSFKLLDGKQNHTSLSDSIISEGTLSDEELANFAKVKEPQPNNLHENASFKNPDEQTEDEIPFWLRKPPMEPHPFNFISAVKMKLRRFLEEQNKNILTDISPNIVQIPKPTVVPSSDGKEESAKESDSALGEPEINYESDFEPLAASGSGPFQNDEKVSAANSSDLDTATEEILPTDEVQHSKIHFRNVDSRKETVHSNSDNVSELSKKSGSFASDQSHFSNSSHQLVAPNFSLSRSGGDLIWKNYKGSESKTSSLQIENIQNMEESNESEVKSMLSLPNATFSNKSDKSSYGSCKTEISVASKSGLASEDTSVTKPDSKNKIIPSTVTLRKTFEEELTPRFNEVVSSNSITNLDKLLTDGSKLSSKDGLSINSGSSEAVSRNKTEVNDESRPENLQSSSLPRHLSSLKELNDKHSQRLAEMEMKASEHRLQMERAFEKERQKLELALEEAKKTVIDSKLEATKFISTAAVELVRSQAEATKANAEATKHISEAKVIDALKLETISAQSASAAAFAAVQAAIKQLQTFKKVKQHSKKQAILENSFPSTVSEAGSSTSEEKSINSTAERESEESSALAEDNSEESKLAEKMGNSDVANLIENAERSLQNVDETVAKNLGAVPEDSSLRSISENISEPEYSSKFDETASEGELKSAPRPLEGNPDAVTSHFTESKGVTESKKVPTCFRKKNELITQNLDSTNETDVSLGSPQLNEESSNTDQDSFTKFSLSMFQQLMREEEMRAQHQQALLKLREDALIDKTKAEMILLEFKKKQYRDKGQEDAISSIRKKQRGLLLRLKLERDEIQRLKKSHKTASHERRMMLTQQQHIVKMRMSTKEIMNKLQTKKLPPTPKAIRAMGFIGSVLDTSKSNVELNTEESALDTRSHSSAVPEEIHSVDVTHSDVSLPTVPAHSSHASYSDSGSHNGQKRNARRLEKQVIHGLNDLERNKKFLSEREKNLIHRRQTVEELLVWRKRLEQEEERVRALESQALVPPSKAQPSFGNTEKFSIFKADRSTSPLHLDSSVEVKLREDAATSMADLSSAHSSILEEVPNESQKSSFSAVDELDSKKNDFADESFKSSASASGIKTEVSAAEQSRDSEDGMKKSKIDSKSAISSVAPLTAMDESKNSSLNITIKSPLTPYIPGRQKRRHSSGSDESIILSQNETASEQSDIEGKVCALQEQLRRRKMEAELLKREQKRCRRERLKAKEQSLIKQIQAYDLYIQKARIELEQECEFPTTSLVKPQIKQPRAVEWKKKLDEPKEVHSEAPEKVSTVESVSEAIEKIPSESQNEVTEKSEKSSTLASLPDTAEKTSELSLKQEDSENLHDLGEPNQMKNDSCSSISEVLEEIQILTEELPTSENSQGSLSRESNVETTIESPTKQDVVESARDSDVENQKQMDLVTEPIKDLSLKNETLKEDLVLTNIETKSDEYDDDTFEPTTGSNIKVEEFSVSKQKENIESLEGPISDDIMEELSSKKQDPLPSEDSEVGNEILYKTHNNDSGVVGNHFVEETPSKQMLEEVSEESVSLPSYIFIEQSAPQLTLDETYVVSEKATVTNAQNEEKAEEITENILKNLLEESVVEAEILINKNSTCTMTVPEFDEKVKMLVPLYEIESYEEVLEQRLEELELQNEEMAQFVNVYYEEVKDEVYIGEIELSDEGSRSSQVNVILSNLLQSLLEDATIEIVRILERRESLFKHKQDDEVMVYDEYVIQSTVSAGRNSDVMKRVQQILFESSLSQVSPREKSRPQDLMITTYDVLSPDSSNCSSPILGHSEMEMVFVQEEKYSPKSPQKYTTGKVMQFLQVEHSGGLGASAAAGESSGAENDAFSQEWFEEDFGLNNTLREVEEIQLQRLQIEREIEQLQLAQAKEQQQKQYPYNFYIREIPNKPPPPYTPPEETPRISASFAGPISPLGTPRDPSPKAAVPTDQEEVANFVQTAAGKFYDAWNCGESLDSVEPPACLKSVVEEEDSYQNEGVVDVDLRRKSRRGYSQFLFDLSRQLVDESLDNVEGEKWVSVPTRFGSKKWKPALPLPGKECFVEEVGKQALVILGFLPRETRDNFMFSWTLKKRDHIEEIIMREVQEEERFWTNFDEEERYIKEQIAESLFELLLADTTKAVAMAYERRAERLSVVDG